MPQLHPTLTVTDTGWSISFAGATLVIQPDQGGSGGVEFVNDGARNLVWKPAGGHDQWHGLGGIAEGGRTETDGEGHALINLE